MCEGAGPPRQFRAAAPYVRHEHRASAMGWRQTGHHPHIAEQGLLLPRHYGDGSAKRSLQASDDLHTVAQVAQSRCGEARYVGSV